jgi:putative ABC transport system permease protein
MMPQPFSWRDYVRSHLPPLGVPPEREIEIVDELALQLEAVYERERRAGASHDAAMIAVRNDIPDWAALSRSLAGPAPHAAASAAAAAPPAGLLNGLGGDLRSAARALRRAPAFTIVAITTLALGLGMTTAAFSVIDTVLIKPLRFGAPDRLVLVHATVPPDNRDTNEIAYPDAIDLAADTQVFSSVSLVLPFAGTATAMDPPERLTGYEVSTSLFATLQVHPALGRAFTDDEGQPGRNNVVILGNGFWRRLGGRVDAIGQTLIIDDLPHTIVGVMPAGFRVEVFNEADAVYRPLTPRHFAAGSRAFRAFRAIARLQDNVSIEQAESAAARIGEDLARQYPDTNRGRAFSLAPLRDDIVGSVRPALLLIAGLVVVVLSIAAVNLTNLLLARAIARAREVAVRSALGANAWRLMRASLVEAALIAMAGAIGGLVVCRVILATLIAMPGVTLPRLAEIGMDWRAISLLAVASALASAGVGVIPFAMHRRLHDLTTLRTGHETAGRREGRMRAILVSAQTALAFILVAAAALLGLSLQRLLAVPAGFDQHVATMRVAVPAPRYPTREATTRFFTELVDDIAAQPGISKAGLVSILPLSGNAGSTMTTQGREDVPMAERPEVGWQWADPGYFDAVGMPIVRGRGFARSDLDRPTHVTVISETLARRYFPGEDPIGKRVYFGGVPDTGVPEWHEIIGVVGDVRHRSLEAEPDARAYDLFGQHWGRTVTLALRTTASPAAAATVVRGALAKRDPHLAVFAVRSTADLVSSAVASRRLLLWLVAAFAVAGLAVAVLGVYGIVSCLVAERQREIGVRVALGASRADIHRLVVSHGFKLVAIGLAFGLGGAVAMRTAIASQLFSISATNLPALAGAALAMLIAAAVPCAIVSRRATRIDPVRALRAE